MVKNRVGKRFGSGLGINTKWLKLESILKCLEFKVSRVFK